MRLAIGIYLLITAAFLLVFYVASPFLESSINTTTVWVWLRPVRGIGIVFMLVIHGMAMREHPANEVAGLSSRMAFYVSFGLAVTLAGVWAGALNPDTQRFENTAYSAIAWTVVIVLYVTMATGTALKIWSTRNERA